MSLDQYREITRVLPEATLLVVSDGEILAANPAAIELLCCPEEQLCGRMLPEMVAEPEKKVRRYLSACASSRQMVFGSLKWLRPNADPVSYRAEGAVIRPRTEGAAALILLRIRSRAAASSNFILLNSRIGGLNKEILLRKIAEEELQRLNETLELEVLQRTSELCVANEELKRSNRELQEFAYVASHDLQEPLRRITTFADLLMQEAGERLEEADLWYLERMQVAARRMHALIQALLQYSRVTVHLEPFQPVDLNITVHDVLADLEVALKNTDGEVEVAALPTIDADPMQMRQLFQNLIGNALKFHRPGVPPLVRISASLETNELGRGVDHDAMILRVEDNGIGFDQRYVEKIFMPFQRLHDRIQFEGTGMGLAICRRIVERHGGQITAQSDLQKGSTFVIALPLLRDQSEAATRNRC